LVAGSRPTTLAESGVAAARYVHVLAARRGCPMDNNPSIDGTVDVPAQVALIVFVSLWGFLSYTAVLSVAAIGS
jgi:hypothetical protein